jgi:hypothetical protein
MARGLRRRYPRWLTMSADACIYCGAKAERWCDLVIGFTDPDGDGLFAMDDQHEILRCDAPLCEAHADHQGNIFFSGTPKVAGVESIDHCCGHRDEGWAQAIDGGWLRNPERFDAISDEEASARRYRHRCSAKPLRLV